MFFVTANPLNIERHPQNQSVNLDQQVTFTCFVTGSNSLFDVTWEKNGKKIDSSSNKITVKNTAHNNGVNSSLIIENVKVKDSGRYSCKATNADEKSFKSTQAELLSKLCIFR